MKKLAADDRLELMDLHARFYTAIDEKNEQMFVDCWAEDDDIALVSEFGTPRGRQGMHEFFNYHVFYGHAIGKRHVVANLTLRPGEDDNTAYSTSYMLVLEVQDLPRLHSTAILRDTKIVRTDKGWRFRLREMELDKGYSVWLAQQPEVEMA